MPKPPRDPARIEPMLDAIRTIWTRYPDLRLAQLIMNCAESNYYLEDEVLLQLLKDTYHQAFAPCPNCGGLPNHLPGSSVCRLLERVSSI